MCLFVSACVGDTGTGDLGVRYRILILITNY